MNDDIVSVLVIGALFAGAVFGLSLLPIGILVVVFVLSFVFDH